MQAAGDQCAAAWVWPAVQRLGMIQWYSMVAQCRDKETHALKKRKEKEKKKNVSDEHAMAVVQARHCVMRRRGIRRQELILH